MLVTFTTKAYADITMFGDIAIAMLKMMGHSVTVPGALRADDVHEALRQLKAAVAANNAPPPHEDKDVDEPSAGPWSVSIVEIGKRVTSE